MLGVVDCMCIFPLCFYIANKVDLGEFLSTLGVVALYHVCVASDGELKQEAKESLLIDKKQKSKIFEQIFCKITAKDL